ncbi:MAG: undecaprenyl/decaprenyl-phosphate alpha-N-acetylglucosaminyl 1-phosphate transferase, partial [bacterium]|nr:undecaprenyl/decaprenyl-phosphate alpha-N-acetylglucosaminyl 1-phosphate transferase [bacterium]
MHSILVSTIFDSSIQFSNTNFILPLLVLSTFIIFITGLLDDFTSMRARYKLVGQIIAALIAIMGGAVINYIDVPFTSIIIKLGPLSIPVTLLWIVGIPNSINLIDGIDGLSSGI